MEDKDIEINTRLLEEFGLEQGIRRRVYDHETGEIRLMKGREIVAPGAIPGKDSIEFDPINNVRMMNFFFGSYIQSMEQDDLLGGSVAAYSVIPSSKQPGKMRAVLKIDPEDGSPLKEIASKSYNNETSCIADLVCRINGDDNVDMSEYDYDRRKPLQKAAIKQPKRRK